jgi:hypothetical protein
VIADPPPYGFRADDKVEFHPQRAVLRLDAHRRNGGRGEMDPALW